MKNLNSWLMLLVATGCYSRITLHEESGVGGTTSGPVSGGTAAMPGGGSSGALSENGGAPASATTAVDPNECSTTTLPAEPTRPGYVAPREPEVALLLNSMSLDAKIMQLYGLPNPPNRDGEIWNDIERGQDVDLGNGKSLRGYRYRDGARGVNLVAGQDNRTSQGNDYSTAFPTPSIRAASWDVELEFRVGEAMGDETMASRNNMLLTAGMNIVRHPYWGRTQEAYGEDAYHVGRMASAFVAGAQQHVVACAEHFTAYNIERNRSYQNAVLDEQTLREGYGRHFEMVVRQGGVGCVMAPYNSIDGKKATQNQHLLTDVLRGDFGFRGFVISDWWAMPGDQTPPDTVTAQSGAAEALLAGLDVEIPWALHYSQLGALVANGTISQSDIDRAAGRVLEQKSRFDTLYTDRPWGLGTAKTQLSGDSIVNNEGHLDLAEETETESAVLLSNGTASAPVLPIGNVTSIAVLGLDVEARVSGMTQPLPTGDRLKLGTDVNIGDRGSSRVNADPAKSIGPYAGIKAAAARHGIANVATSTDVAAALAADVVVVVVGLTAGDEGEEYSIDTLGDRTSLSLGSAQEAFVNDVLSLNKPTAIVVESGSIVNLPWLSHVNRKQATIWAGYGGQRQGAALGRLLLGEANFSGKLPFAWPKERDLPAFTSSDLSTQMGYFFGYRDYDRRGISANLMFPFGWGLSYTRFAYSNLTPPCGSTKKDNVVTYVTEVTNTGSVDGEEVVMLFVAGPPTPPSIKGNRPIKELKSFAKVRLAAGQTAKVSLPLDIRDLRHWEGDAKGRWIIDNGTYQILVGPNASDSALTLKAQLVVHD